MTDIIEKLTQIPIFSKINSRDLKMLVALSVERFYSKGETIIEEGDTDRALYVVIKGMADVIKNRGRENEHLLRVIVPGDYVGEMSLIDNMARSSTVIARSDTQVLSITHSNFYNQIKHNPEIALELLGMLSRRIREIENQMVNTIGRFLPICANCKAVRQQDKTWKPIDSYISSHSEITISHVICPDCSEKLYQK